MRRLRTQAGGALATSSGSPPSAGLLWEPDYSSESNSVQSGAHATTNPGLVSGKTWHTAQPPYIRGIKQSPDQVILTGSDVPGTNSDPYRPPGCLSVYLTPPKTPNDFLITCMQSYSATATTLYFPAAELQQTSGDGYTGLQFNDLGDTFSDKGVVDPTTDSAYGPTYYYGPSGSQMTIQQAGGVSYQDGDGGHVRLSVAVNTAQTATNITFEGIPWTQDITVTNGDGSMTTTNYPVTDSNNSQIILPLYNADGSVKYAIGQSIPCWSVTVVRGLESAAGAILAGSQFNVTTGRIFDLGNSWTSRSELYDRFPLTPASSTNAGNWPDPVGSERWYSISYFIPTGTDFTDAPSNSNWIDVSQWKGQYGGSPPRAVGIDPNGDGTAHWTIDHDGVPLYSLGDVTLGVWTHFVFGYLWGTTGTSGWTTVYKNGNLVTDSNHGLLSQNAGATMDARSTWTQNGTQTGASQITIASSTAATVSDLLTGTGIPNQTYVSAKSGAVLTTSNPISLSGTVSIKGTTADPIYYKNGIYRSVAWTNTYNFYFSAPKVGLTIDDV
jgi:hypothetical protein